MKENPNLTFKAIAFTVSLVVLIIGIIKIMNNNIKEKKKKEDELESKPKKQNDEFSRLPDPKGKPTIRP